MSKLVNKKVIPIILAALIIIGSTTGILIKLFGGKSNILSEQTEAANEDNTVVNIKIWHSFSGEQKNIFEKDIVSAYKKKNPKIRLMPVKVDYDLASLVTAAADGKAPDIIIVPDQNVSDLVEKDIAVNLTGKKEFSDIKATSFNQLYDLVKYNNNYYGLPIDALADVALYKKDSISTVPTELKNVSSVAVSAFDCKNMLSLFFSAGGLVMDQDIKQSVGFLNGSQSVSAAAELVKESAKFKVTEHPLDAVSSGTCQMTIANSKVFSEEGYKADDFTAGQIPTSCGAASKSMLQCDAAVIISSSKVKDPAWQFLQYLSGDEAQGILSKGGNLPSNDSVAKSDSVKKNIPFSAEYIEAIKNGQLRILPKRASQIIPYISKAISAFMGGEKTPADALGLCAKQVEAILYDKPLPLDSTDATLEAESGKLFGTASVGNADNASEGKYVHELNWADGNPNKLVFENIQIQKKGTYELRIGYSSGTNGGVAVVVNGVKLACQYSITDGEWSFVPNTVSMDIPLKGDGTDTLEFYDIQPGCYIWLDYIQLCYKNSEYYTPESIDHVVDDGRIEAESGILSGTAVVNSDFRASGGKYVCELNAKDDNGTVSYPNKVRFDAGLLNVSRAGSYRVTVGYSAGISGVLGLNVNGKNNFYNFEYSGTLNNWTFAPSTIEFTIYLNGDGSDKLTFFDQSNYIWLDYFRLDYISSERVSSSADGRIEAESGDLFGNAYVYVDQNASNQQVVTGLDAISDHSNRVRFNKLPISQRGTYTLFVSYNSVMDGTLLVFVNGIAYEMTWTASDTSNTWTFSPGLASIDIPLNGNGSDEISIAIKDSGAYIWLDYLRLEFKSPYIAKPAGLVEAEDGQCKGAAFVGNNASASSGAYISGLDYVKGYTNSVSFSSSLLNLSSSGLYNALFGYTAENDATLGISVNGTIYELKCPSSGSGYTLSSALLNRIPLRCDGNDSIVVFCINGSVCLDYFILSKKENYPPANHYEAENAVLYGQAQAHNYENDAFSNGGWVDNFNYDHPGSFVRFKDLGISAQNAGRYRIIIKSYAYNSGSVGIRVNGNETTALLTGTGEFNFISTSISTAEISLRGNGEDYIDIFVPDSATSWIWLDYIELEYINDDVSDLTGNRIEAENAECSPGVQPVRDEQTGTISMPVGTNSSLKFSNISQQLISKKGMYSVGIVYHTDSANAKLTAVVSNSCSDPNGTEYMIDLLPSSGYLTAVKNVMFYGDGNDVLNITATDAVNIDYITISYFGPVLSGVTIEAENCTYPSGNKVIDMAASDAAAVMGLTGGNKLTASNLPVETAGLYNLQIRYKASADVSLSVTVNGRPETVSCIASDKYVMTQKLSVILTGDGTDTIEIAENTNVGVYIDYITLNMEKSIVKANTLYSVYNATAHGDTNIVFGIAYQLVSKRTEGANYNQNGVYQNTGDSYLEYQDIAVYKPGFYRIALDASLSDDAITHGWGTKFVVTADQKQYGVFLSADGSINTPVIYLNGDGTDSIRIEEFTGGTYGFASLAGITLSPMQIDYYAEAENADSVNGTINDVNQTGEDRVFKASGLAYVDSFHEATVKDGLIFNHVSVDDSGEYVLNIRCLAGCESLFKITVNGVDIYNVSHITCTDWSSFATIQTKVNLKKGDNTVQIQYGNDSTYSAIDYIYLSKSENIVEFEDPQYVSYTSGRAESYPQYSGGAVINNINNGQVTIKNMPCEAGYYCITFAAVPAFGSDIPVFVNGDKHILQLSRFVNMFNACTYQSMDTMLEGAEEDAIMLDLKGNWASLDYVCFEYIGDTKPLL